VREEFVDEVEASAHNPKGLPERTLQELRLHEFGPVTFPAYETATAEVRSLTDSFMLSRALEKPDLLRDALARAGAAALAQQEPVAATPEESRRTQRQHDYLRDGEGAKTWQL
jgi:hypothetical protein